MKATEFAKFFEFTIQTVEEYGRLPQDEDSDLVKYIVTDDQGVFDNRYISDVAELSDCFDSMLVDYIDSDLEENGFEYNPNSKGTYYEQALKWIEEDASDIYTKGHIEEIIQALVDPFTIEDDVREMEMIV